MAKPENGSFWSELLTFDLYKRNQGRLARQLTAAGFGAMVVAGAYVLSQGPLHEMPRESKIGIPFLITAAAGWVIYRLVNYPRFAEFLISVEAEMGKVSWASKQELYRATIVVLSTMLFLGVILFFYDLLWQKILFWIHVLPGPPQ
jgi:preprotein translocase subunit SecE